MDLTQTDDDRSMTIQRFRSVPALFRQLAEDWEAGEIVVGSLPSILSPKEMPEGATDLAVCLINKSRLKACEQSRELLSTLTSREYQVLELVVEGMRAKHIAFELGVSQRTVENHISSIFRKTMTHRMAELLKIVYASLYW